MKKLYCTKLDRLHEETEHCADGCVAVYLASEVDASIAELDKLATAISRDCNATALERNQLRDRIAELERENEKYEEALQRIAKWSDAYPLDVFPEPNFYTVARVLKENGLSLDQVSASNMRHVVDGVGKIAKSVL